MKELEKIRTSAKPRNQKLKMAYEYIKALEKERDEYKLKEEIAHTAKEIAQEAHQKAVISLTHAFHFHVPLISNTFLKRIAQCNFLVSIILLFS